jgi:hypothetical protein
MANKKATRHTHKYYQVDVNYATIWACALPGCNHHMPPYYSKLLNGKYSICWNCGEQMTLNPINMMMEQPICEDCRLGKELAEKVRNIG